MSLDYDVTDVNKSSFPKDDEGLMHDDLHVLIWTTMAVGIGHITEENAREFYDRQVTWVDEVAPLFNKLDHDKGTSTPYIVPLAQVRAAAGLRTNVGPLSNTEFREKVNRAKADNEAAKRRVAARAKN